MLTIHKGRNSIYTAAIIFRSEPKKKKSKRVKASLDPGLVKFQSDYLSNRAILGPDGQVIQQRWYILYIRGY